MSRIRYSIIPIEVQQSREIVAINHKLPPHLERCTGYIVRHTKGITYGDDLPEIGLITLEFNSRKRLFVNDLICYSPRIEELPSYRGVQIPLENGQLVTGYYMDTGMIPGGHFTPYRVSVYLRCELGDETKDAQACSTTCTLSSDN